MVNIPNEGTVKVPHRLWLCVQKHTPAFLMPAGWLLRQVLCGQLTKILQAIRLMVSAEVAQIIPAIKCRWAAEHQPHGVIADHPRIITSRLLPTVCRSSGECPCNLPAFNPHVRLRRPPPAHVIR